MTEQAQNEEIVKTRTDSKNQIILEITRPDDGQTLKIYVKAPVLGEIIRKMIPTNWPKDDYMDIYKPILLPLEANKNRVVTRGSIAKITKNFVGGTDFSWDAPRACLLYNPDALVEGYTLTYKVETPIPPDTIRKWGKMFMEGCNDIIANARPVKMTWLMDEMPEAR